MESAQFPFIVVEQLTAPNSGQIVFDYFISTFGFALMGYFRFFAMALLFEGAASGQFDLSVVWRTGSAKFGDVFIINLVRGITFASILLIVVPTVNYYNRNKDAEVKHYQELYSENKLPFKLTDEEKSTAQNTTEAFENRALVELGWKYLKSTPYIWLVSACVFIGGLLLNFGIQFAPYIIVDLHESAVEIMMKSIALIRENLNPTIAASLLIWFLTSGVTIFVVGAAFFQLGAMLTNGLADPIIFLGNLLGYAILIWMVNVVLAPLGALLHACFYESKRQMMPWG